MIERKFVEQNMTEHGIKEFVKQFLNRAGLSDVTLMKTPLGEKIVVKASRPGLVVGRGGVNIALLTKELKKKFNLDNPQVEIEEVENPNLDPEIVAENITSALERFGSNRFKGIGYRAIQDVMSAGARGVEVLISGKVPSARARTWRFYSGYLKKCGDIALTGVDTAYKIARLKSGVVGVKVSIMPPTTKLPDDIEVFETITGLEETSPDQALEEEKSKAEEEEVEG